MKIKIFFSIIPLLFFVELINSQTAGFIFSSIKCAVPNNHDSLSLIRNEQKMWLAASKGNVLMFDNPMLDCEFKVRMSKTAVMQSFKDSIPTKSGASFYLMNLMENRNVDTCYLMSFSPFLSYKFQSRGSWVGDSIQQKQQDTSRIGSATNFAIYSGHYELGPWVKGFGVRFLMPLSEYPKVLSTKEMLEEHRILANCFSKIIDGKFNGDTIYRTVSFTCDSNEYLPQAPYANLIAHLQNDLYSGKLPVYFDSSMKIRMSLMAFKSACAGWDSTNQVEDPNNPGVFIIAPIAIIGKPKSFLICERWTPFDVQTFFPYYSQPFKGYRREVTVYGLKLTNGSILWLEANEVNKILFVDHYNFTPYEECFRAERFKSLQVQLHTW